MALHFDQTNLLAAMVGEQHGLTPADIEAGRPHAEKALAGVKAIFESGKQGFAGLPADTATINAVGKFAQSAKGSYDTVCLIGIGGSALGAWALDCGLRGPHPVQGNHSAALPRLVILDNVDPVFTAGALASMNPKKTLVVAIAKSGSTAETIATFLIVQDWMKQSLGKKAKDRIVIVTSENRGELKALATGEGYVTFHIPENVGGRFSVLSTVGLVPAALIGLDIKKICKGAAKATVDSWSSDLNQNLALRGAFYHWLILTKKKKAIQVAFPYSNRMWGTAFWFRQLWAESLGKAKDRKGKTVNVGQTPIAALGTTDQHSQVQLYMEGPNDKVYTFWSVAKPSEAGAIPKVKTGFASFDYLAGQSLAKLIDAERRATEAALTSQNRPNCHFILDKMDEEHLGAFLQVMEFETAFMGEFLNIDAFDQEGVELGKKLTYGLMGRKEFADYKKQMTDFEAKKKSVN
jgi:glucose-6-phosphate isomerase